MSKEIDFVAISDHGRLNGVPDAEEGSVGITDEQLQGIEARYAEGFISMETMTLQEHAGVILREMKSSIGTLLQAIRESKAFITDLKCALITAEAKAFKAEAEVGELRDQLPSALREKPRSCEEALRKRENEVERLECEVAELRKPILDSVVSQLSGFLSVLASYSHITGDQTEKLRATASLMISMQSQLAELRKPVAVERNEAVEAARGRRTSHVELWKLGDFVSDFDKLLSAYDTLAQDCARTVNAWHVALAERNDAKERERRLRVALERIVAWQMPSSGRTWDDGTPMSYSAAFGSNGERDYIKSIARAALAASPAVAQPALAPVSAREMRLREALEWYANPGHWSALNSGDESDADEVLLSGAGVCEHGWERASNALAALAQPQQKQESGNG